MWLTSVLVYCCAVCTRMGRRGAVVRAEQSNGTVRRGASATELDAENETAWQGDWEFVHVVETRFMQSQAHLIELGLARLALFEAFCLPTMLSQTKGEFIWIIRTDPSLHPSIRGTMVQLLRGRQNFVLVGSNSNPEGFGRTGTPFEDFMRDDARGPSAIAPVWSGDVSLVKEAYKRSAAGAVLLETRLDADDGLHRDFVKTVQAEASQCLAGGDGGEGPDGLWRLWCVHSNFEWHPLNPYPQTPEVRAANGTFKEGYLVLYADRGTCVTPGLTFGYGRGATRSSLGLDHLRHDEIVKRVRPCGGGGVGVGCVSRLEGLSPGALRARTATSAGMRNVVTGDEDFDNEINGFRSSAAAGKKGFMRQYFQQERLWRGAGLLFSVVPGPSEFARSVVVGRMSEIAQDNLRGQCTPGHSCKNGTRLMLGRMTNE